MLGAYVAWPVARIGVESFWISGEGFSFSSWVEFGRQGHWIYTLRSIWVSLLTVVLSGIVGCALAVFYYRLDFPGRGLFSGLTLLPFTLPPLIGVFAIWMLMGEEGPFNSLTRTLLGKGYGFDRGYAGVLLVHTYSMFIYFYVLVGGALSNFDESQLEAARDLGASRVMVFFKIMLPQMAPALSSACLLCFMNSMASFTAPFFYLAGKPVLTVGIQQALEESQNGLASASSMVMAVCAGLFLYLSMQYENREAWAGRGAPRRPMHIRHGIFRWGCCIVSFFITLLLIAPHLWMVRESLVRPGTGFVGIPVEYTLQNYMQLFQRSDTFGPIWNSLRASALATGAVVLFALLTSWLLVRRNMRGGFLLRGMIMLPWALPGTVIAVGLLWISRQPNALTGGLPLRGTIMILALAYFIRLLPLAHRTIQSGLLQIPDELEKAGRDLGATPFQAFGRIVAPLLFPSILAAATLAFATGMGEFVSSILLYAPGTEPISVRIDQLRRGPGGIHAAAAYSTLLLCIILIVFGFFGRRYKRSL